MCGGGGCVHASVCVRVCVCVHAEHTSDNGVCVCACVRVCVGACRTHI